LLNSSIFVGRGWWALQAFGYAVRPEAIKMVRLGDKSQAEIAEIFNVDRSTISRMVKAIKERELLKTVR
jgi:DNA-binding MarR family transcriptional regulator